MMFVKRSKLVINKKYLNVIITNMKWILQQFLEIRFPQQGFQNTFTFLLCQQIKDIFHENWQLKDNNWNWVWHVYHSIFFHLGSYFLPILFKTKLPCDFQPLISSVDAENLDVVAVNALILKDWKFLPQLLLLMLDWYTQQLFVAFLKRWENLKYEKVWSTYIFVQIIFVSIILHSIPLST